MAKKVYKTTRKYQCPFCDSKLPRMELIDHVEKAHEELIPENYTPTRVVYDSINKTDHGTCMICKKNVYEWNEKTSRYNNLCGSQKCRDEVRRIALERHIRTYNTPTLLNDPEHQEEMLAHRHISGKYKHSDGATITYTGKYEKAAIEFMDKVMNIPSKDIQMPGPILDYEYNGETHSWITDIYYIPANLIIEVKDGGDNPNKRNMPIYRDKQYAKEVMITELGKFNYLRLTNNDFSQLLIALAEIKYENMDQRDAPKVNFFINESAIHEEVGGIPPRRATANWIEPCMMSNTFDSFAIGNDSSNVVYIGSIGDQIKKVSSDEYRIKYNNPSEAIVYIGDDAMERFNNLSKLSPSTINDAINIIAGFTVRTIDELALQSYWRYIDYEKFNTGCSMRRTGVIRENQILTGEIKTIDSNNQPIKGSVFLSRSDKGYFIHTPKSYYLSSDFYDIPDEIPQNIIDTMDDLYKQWEMRTHG